MSAYRKNAEQIDAGAPATGSIAEDHYDRFARGLRGEMDDEASAMGAIGWGDGIQVGWIRCTDDLGGEVLLRADQVSSIHESRELGKCCVSPVGSDALLTVQMCKEALLAKISGLGVVG